MGPGDRFLRSDIPPQKKAVARAWDTRIIARIADRLEALRASGIPRSVYGRVLLQKNLLFGKAVFFATNQVPLGMATMVEDWQRSFTDLLWSTTSGDHRASAGAQRGRPPSLVRLPTAVQDHSDGGCRALHVQLFTEALRVSWVRRLLDPAPAPWKNLVWACGFAACPAGMERCGEHVLSSSSSLQQFASALPPLGSLFREAMLTWGRMPTPRLTTAAQRQALPLEAVETMPLWFNPAAAEADHEPDPRSVHAALRRTRDEAIRARREAVATKAAAQHFVLVRDLLPYVTVEVGPHAALRARLDRDALRARCRCRDTVAALHDVAELWPQRWLRTIARGRQPCKPGEWVCLVAGARLHVGRLRMRAPGGRCVVRMWQADRMNRITESSYEHVCDVNDLSRALCWLQTPVEAPERTHYRNSMVPRKHVPPPCWRFAGPLCEPRIDPTVWLMRGRPTLREQPVECTFARMINREAYAALLSRLFDESGDANAFPRAFEPPRMAPQPHHAGCWHRLVPGMHGLATSHPTTRTLVREVFTLSRTQAMPLRARQSLWQLHTGGLPIGARTGGDGYCPIVDAMRASGSQLARARETHDQIALYSPTARLVWQHIAAAWLHFAGGQWAVTVASGQPDLDAQRAVLLGIRPQSTRTFAEPFALLRGITVLELVSHRHCTWLSLRDGVDQGEYDHVRALRARATGQNVTEASSHYETDCRKA